MVSNKLKFMLKLIILYDPKVKENSNNCFPFQDIPIVLGVNADEGSMFVAMAWNNMDKLSKNWTYFVSITIDLIFLLVL